MSLQPKRLAEEGVPVAAILLFWYLLAVIVQFSSALSSTVGNAGVVMAGVYVVIRGTSLSSEVPSLDTGSIAVVLYENARVALPAGVWFLAAAVAYALHQSYYNEVFGVIAGALAGAGLGVVALYAVAVGVATFDSGIRGDAAEPDDESLADTDDETPADD